MIFFEATYLKFADKTDKNDFGTDKNLVNKYF